MSGRGIVYNTTTGKIRYLVTTSGPYYDQPTESDEISLDISHIEGSLNVNRIYYDVVNSEVIDRPTMSLVVSGLIVSGVPTSTSLTVRDAQDNVNTYQVDDGVVDLTGSSTGAYTLLFENFPYQSIQEIITV